MSGSKVDDRYLELDEVTTLTAHHLAEQKSRFKLVVSKENIHRDKKKPAGEFHAFADFDGYVIGCGLKESKEEKLAVIFGMPNTVESAWSQTNLTSNIKEYIYRIIKAQISSVDKWNKDKKDTEKSLNYDFDLYIPLSNGGERYAGGHWNYVLIKFRDIEGSKLQTLKQNMAVHAQALANLEQEKIKQKELKSQVDSNNSIDRNYNTNLLIPLRNDQWKEIKPLMDSLYNNVTIEFTDPKHWLMDIDVWRTLKAVFPNRAYSGWVTASSEEWPFSYTLLWFIPAFIVCVVLKVFLANSALAMVGGFWGMLGIAVGAILFVEVLRWWINREPSEPVVIANPNKHLSFSQKMDCAYQDDGYTCGDRTALSMVRRAADQSQEDKRVGEQIRAASLRIISPPPPVPQPLKKSSSALLSSSLKPPVTSATPVSLPSPSISTDFLLNSST